MAIKDIDNCDNILIDCLRLALLKLIMIVKVKNSIIKKNAE